MDPSAEAHLNGDASRGFVPLEMMRLGQEPTGVDLFAWPDDLAWGADAEEPSTKPAKDDSEA